MSATAHPTSSAVVSQSEMASPKGRRWISALTLTVLFLILAFIFVLPLYLMVLSSTRPGGYIFTEATNLMPSYTTLDNYSRLFAQFPFGRWFLNSVLQAGGYALVTVTLCSLGGFALAKYKFRFRNALFILILVSQMLPFNLLIVSLFVMMINFGMVESYLGAILPLAAHPIGIFFMRQYMLSIEDELLDAARVDGANEYQLFYKIVLPNIRPAIATLLVLFVLEYWNNLLWPLIVFRNPQNMPLAVGIASLVGQYRPSFDLVMAASTLATLPIIALFIFLRKQFMEGIAATGTGMK
ncbi:MAG: carbohydrate ABC transporter permease [Burkholderiales bacterium]|nr:carbohydrate ABC transporter permease [Anaerolineae bacterium]